MNYNPPDAALAAGLIYIHLFYQCQQLADQILALPAGTSQFPGGRSDLLVFPHWIDTLTLSLRITNLEEEKNYIGKLAGEIAARTCLCYSAARTCRGCSASDSHTGPAPCCRCIAFPAEQCCTGIHCVNAAAVQWPVAASFVAS
jgi:hypothetical protein